MDRSVFQDEEIGGFINEHFLALRIHGNKEEGKAFREKYPISGYPHVIFVKPDGEEYERIAGFGGNKEVYFEILKDYAAGKNLLSTFLAELDKSPDDVELNYKIGKKYIDRWDSEKAKPYLEKVLALDPDNEKGCRTECQLELAIYEGRFKKNIVPLKTFISQVVDDEFLHRAYENLIRYYERIEKDSAKVLETYAEALVKFPNDADGLNGYAWFIYTKRIKSMYAEGIQMAEKAVKIAPEGAGIWDTLGWLLYETGDLQKATDAMQKAHDISPDSKYFNKNLEKFKKELEEKETT